ncbi:MAG TPA: hypothetical protein VFT96_01220 [Gemmatimonadaceae bacterium]|nr:hypothetical protein [Gemmatimonadaceae bacterium]
MTTPSWLTPERQIRIRNVLFGLLVFFGLVIWIFHSIASNGARPPEFVQRLRVLGIMTWLYALVQLLDMRFYHSRFAKRRIEAANVPEHMLAWLLAQMLPWYGILYYALVADIRWYVVGLCLAALTTWAYPVPTGRAGMPDRLGR